MKRQKWITAAAAFAAAVLLSLPVQAAPETGAQSCILMDGDTGAVLYSKNPEEEALIASTTKIMTALVVLEHWEDLTTPVIIPREAVGIEGSSLYLREGEELTVEALLYGMMLHSGNDAAAALALATCPTMGEFVEKMNRKARELGLEHTSFANPHGLDGENHYSTALDLGRLTLEALRDPRFEKIVSTKQITIGGRTLGNHNKLLWSCPGALGVKTGYTKAAGRILVSAARRQGRRLIAVTLRDSRDWLDHRMLYDYGFGLYSPRCILKKGERAGFVPGLDGRDVPLLAGEDVVLSLRPEEEPAVRFVYPRLSYGPQTPGSAAGWGLILQEGVSLGRVPLVWGNTEVQYEGTNTENYCRPGAYLPAKG